MKVTPSIDLLEGKCVRLVRGEKRSVTVYEKTPLEIAVEYVRYGASRIHVVDLDGAFSGQMKNLPIIEQLARRFPIQVGGGVRSEDCIRQLLNLGVQKVVVSSLLFDDPALAARIKEQYFGRLVGSLDFKDGKLSYRGWTRQSPLAFQTVAAGLAEIIVTDTDRDGTLGGPDLQFLQTLRTQTRASIFAAGGIRDVADLFELKRIGIDGAIIGKAFLENKIALRNGFRFEKMVVD